MEFCNRLSIFLIFVSSLILCHPAVASAGDIFKPTPVEVAPKIDGILDEAIWSTAFEVDELTVIEPDLKVPGSLKTQFKLAYDKKALYVSVICEQPADTQVRRISARDMQFYSRDSVTVVLDPSGNGRYGYRFGVALGGSLIDGTIREEKRSSFNWDAPWQAATSSDEDHWYAEIAIPWDVMEWPAREGKRHLGIFLRRHVSHLSEYWGVPAIPFTANVFLSSLATMEVHDINPRGRLTLYPYISVEYDNITQKRKEALGTDLFWQASSNMMVSATVNPDFGQVENDSVVVNFGAIETFFQDKRPFFVEGNDIFRTPGLLLVHTRRIGQAPGTPEAPSGEWITDAPMVTDILTAAKITGQKKNLRYGFMSAFEDASDFTTNTGGEVTLDGSQFYVARALYEHNGSGKGSTALGYLATFVDHEGTDAWVHSLDGRWLTGDERYQLETQVAVSDVEGEQGYAWNGKVVFNPENGTYYSLAMDYADDRVNINDMGYLGRNDFFHFRIAYSRTRYDLPQFKTLNYHFDVEATVNDRLLSGTVDSSFMVRLHNNTDFSAQLKYYPRRWDDISSRGNGDYRKKEGFNLRAGWNSDNSKSLRLYLFPSVFSEENGGISTRLSASLGIDIRDDWLASINLRYYSRHDWILWETENRMNGFDADQLQITMDSNYKVTAKQELRLGFQWVGLDARGETAYRIGPEGHLNESGEEIASKSFDYAEFSGQIRYKYEFAPLSDLFIVYSRGGRVYWGADAKTDDFGDLLADTFEDRAVDHFLAKIRYRF